MINIDTRTRKNLCNLNTKTHVQKKKWLQEILHLFNSLLIKMKYIKINKFICFIVKNLRILKAKTY